MISELTKGDKIITQGGLICEVVKPELDFIKVKINDEGILAKISKKFIAEKFDATLDTTPEQPASKTRKKS